MDLLVPTARCRSKLADALNLAGVTASNPVYVSGDDALALLLWLCANGYEHVFHVPEHASVRVGPDGVLIAPRTLDGPALEALLAQCARMAPGGRVVAQTPRSRRPDQRAATDRTFARAGFSAEPTVLASPFKEIWVARRLDPAVKKAA